MPYRRLKYGFLLILIFNILNRKTKWVSCIAVDLKAEIYCNKEGVHKLRSAFRADRLIVVVSKCKHQEGGWGVRCKRFMQVPAISDFKNKLLKVEVSEANEDISYKLKSKSNLNNYFNFHVCLSIRPSIIPFVCVSEN